MVKHGQGNEIVRDANDTVISDVWSIEKNCAQSVCGDIYMKRDVF